MKLHEYIAPAGAKRSRKRKGRGNATGQGKTGGRGMNGQKQRSGGGVRLGFEGGQMPLYRRLPKRGFTNRNSLDIEAINLGALEAFDNDAEVTVEALLEKGIIKSAKDGVKILGNGTLTKKLNVKVNAYSESAKSKIEELGGKAEVI